MRHNRWIAGILPILAGLLLCAIPLQAQTIKDVVRRSMFADKKAFNEGDIITVMIVEFAQGSNQVDTRTNSDNRLTTDAGSSGGLSNLIPSFGLNSQLANRYESEGATTTKGTLESKMTAIVTEVMDNGLLSIQGTRVVEVNGDKQTTVLTGLVRPEDVQSDNSIYSYHIANAQIAYTGKGAMADAGKPGFFTRIFNWIF